MFSEASANQSVHRVVYILGEGVCIWGRGLHLGGGGLHLGGLHLGGLHPGRRVCIQGEGVSLQGDSASRVGSAHPHPY